MGFFNHGFEIPDSVCNDCHDLTMLIVNKKNIVIMSIKNVDYCCIIRKLSNLKQLIYLKNCVLEDREYI